MAADAQNQEKSLVKAAADGAVAGAMTGAGAVETGHLLKDGHQAAMRYGKNQPLGDLPTNADLLAQIAIDQKARPHQLYDRLNYKDEKDVAAHMTPEELRSVGQIVDAIKHQNYGSANTEGSLAAALKQYKDNAPRLGELKDMIALELERQKLTNYHVDIQAYSERGKDKRAVLVSNDKNRTSVSFTTDGVKGSDDLNKLIYD
jgi:hypothetical protein